MTNYWTKVKIEYTNKKWDLDTMRIKIKNLEKIIPFHIVHMHLSINKVNAKSELDAYYLTYYQLKDIFLKYKRSSYGDTTKNIKKEYELNWEDILNEQLIPATIGLSSNYTNAYINNSIYGHYITYDNYATSLVMDYDVRL
jgi:hypothetical protein